MNPTRVLRRILATASAGMVTVSAALVPAVPVPTPPEPPVPLVWLVPMPDLPPGPAVPDPAGPWLVLLRATVAIGADPAPDPPGWPALRVHRWAHWSAGSDSETVTEVWWTDPQVASYQEWQRTGPPWRQWSRLTPETETVPAVLRGPQSWPADLHGMQRAVDTRTWAPTLVLQAYADLATSRPGLTRADRAVLLHALAQEPDLRWLGTGVDPIGRTSLAITRQTDGRTEVLWLQPATGQILGYCSLPAPGPSEQNQPSYQLCQTYQHATRQPPTGTHPRRPV